MCLVLYLLVGISKMIVQFIAKILYHSRPTSSCEICSDPFPFLNYYSDPMVIENCSIILELTYFIIDRASTCNLDVLVDFVPFHWEAFVAIKAAIHHSS